MTTPRTRTHGNMPGPGTSGARDGGGHRESPAVPARDRGARLLAALAACCLAPLALAACSPATTPVAATSSAPASPAPLPSCRAPGPAALPHSVGSLTQADTGVYCLSVGKLLDIFLTAPAGATTRWSEIRITDASVLEYGNNGVMTAMRDVTPGVVIGRARGTTTVTSTLPDGKTWTATIVVS